MPAYCYIEGAFCCSLHAALQGRLKGRKQFRAYILKMEPGQLFLINTVIWGKELNCILFVIVEYFLSQSIPIAPKPPVGLEQMQPT